MRAHMNAYIDVCIQTDPHVSAYNNTCRQTHIFNNNICSQ